MSHADRPHLTRPLAGVDQALGEGRARQPVELLDQLRERLDRLDQNHPSASRITPGRRGAQARDAATDQDVAADPAADPAAAPGEQARASRPDRSAPRKEGTDSSRDDQASDQGAGEPLAARQAGQPAASDSGAGGQATDGQYRIVDGRRGDKGERYRPWFADEPGTPWFACGPSGGQEFTG